MERYEEIWRKQRREKVYDAICWIAVGILVLFAVVGGLIRGVGVLAAMVSLFSNSPLPWWILTPAAIAIVAGFAYLFKKNRRTRIRPKQKLLD